MKKTENDYCPTKVITMSIGRIYKKVEEGIQREKKYQVKFKVLDIGPFFPPPIFGTVRVTCTTIKFVATLLKGILNSMEKLYTNLS